MSRLLKEEAWHERFIDRRSKRPRTPQGFADCLLEQVIRHHDGEIEDDMTVVVSKVETDAPEWATIRIPGVNRVGRKHVAGL